MFDVAIGKKVVVDGISFRFSRPIACFSYPWSDTHFCLPFAPISPCSNKGRQGIVLSINVLWLPADPRWARALAEEAEKPEPLSKREKLVFARELSRHSASQKFLAFGEQHGEDAGRLAQGLQAEGDFPRGASRDGKRADLATPLAAFGWEHRLSWYRSSETFADNTSSTRDLMVLKSDEVVISLAVLSYPPLAEEQVATLVEEIRVVRRGKPPGWLAQSIANAGGEPKVTHD